jgi:renalase
MNEIVDVLVVGAGLGGLSAARDLSRAGLKLRVLDKGRGVGGRAATRRVAGAVMDHGAPFFTARGERLKTLIASLEARGIVRVWTNGLHTWRDGELIAPVDGHPRYIATDGMSALGKALRDGLEPGDAPLEVSTEATVTAVQRSASGWSVRLDNGQTLHARSVLVNAPAPQALNLTGQSLTADTRTALERVRFEACWAMLGLLRHRPEVSWKGIKLQHPALDWIGLEHTKRDCAPSVVVHASAAWSALHLEENPDGIVPQMLEALREVIGDSLEVGNATAHRWRFAKASQMHPAATVTQDGLVFCGDWCDADGHGSRVENALESGWAAARYLQNDLE